jgi:hypothetical protein
LLNALLADVRDLTKKHYDDFVDLARQLPPVPRIVAVEEELKEHMGDKIMPAQEVSTIIDACAQVALAHCYCRHGKDLLDDPCKVTDDKSNCFLLGKSAQFASKYEFAKTISKDEAKRILAPSAAAASAVVASSRCTTAAPCRITASPTSWQSSTEKPACCANPVWTPARWKRSR